MTKLRYLTQPTALSSKLNERKGFLAAELIASISVGMFMVAIVMFMLAQTTMNFLVLMDYGIYQDIEYINKAVERVGPSTAVIKVGNSLIAQDSSFSLSIAGDRVTLKTLGKSHRLAYIRDMQITQIKKLNLNSDKLAVNLIYVTYTANKTKVGCVYNVLTN